MASRIQLIQALIRVAEGELFAGQATSGTTTTLTDTSADSPLSRALSVSPTDTSSTFFHGATLYIHTGTNAGSEARISAYNPSTQTITVADTQGQAYATSSQYELHRHSTRAQKVEALNRALTTRCFYETWAPLSLLQDADMERSDTSAWTPSNATLAKITTTAVGPIRWEGMRALSVQATAANGYAYQRVLTRVGQQFILEADAQPASSGSAPLLQVVDATGNQLAAGALDGSDGQNLGRILLQFTVPATPYIDIRLREQTNGATSYWDNIVLLERQSYRVPAPEWLKHRSQFLGAFVRSWDQPDQERWPQVYRAVPHLSPTAARGGWIELSGDALGRPVYIHAYRYYEPLTSDSDTTECPEAWAVAAAHLELLLLLWNTRGGDRSGLKEDLEAAQDRLREFRNELAEPPRGTPITVRRNVGTYYLFDLRR